MREGASERAREGGDEPRFSFFFSFVTAVFPAHEVP